MLVLMPLNFEKSGLQAFPNKFFGIHPMQMMDFSSNKKSNWLNHTSRCHMTYDFHFIQIRDFPGMWIEWILNEHGWILNKQLYLFISNNSLNIVDFDLQYLTLFELVNYHPTHVTKPNISTFLHQDKRKLALHYKGGLGFYCKGQGVFNELTLWISCMIQNKHYLETFKETSRDLYASRSKYVCLQGSDPIWKDTFHYCCHNF